MNYLISILLIFFSFSSMAQLKSLDYLYRFPEKGGSVVEYSIYWSLDEMEFDDRSGGVEEFFEVDRSVLVAGINYRYSISDRFLIAFSTHAEVADFDTHLEDENDSETPEKSPFAFYDPSINLRYRLIQENEVFFDIEASIVWGATNSSKTPLNRTVSPFDGQEYYKIAAYTGIDFNTFSFMGVIGANFYNGGVNQSEFNNERLKAQDSSQVLLGFLGQAKVTKNIRATVGFNFLSADAFDLTGVTERVNVDQSTQQNYYIEFDYLKFQNSLGIISFKVNQRIDRYNLLINNNDLYVADNTFLDFIFKVEKWF